MDAPQHLRLADLRFPLEGGVRFGHKGRNRSRNLQAAHARTRRVAHLAAQIHNGREVFICFRGQADHKVEFDLLPAVFEQFLGVQDNFVFRNAFIDNIAQALAARLRRQSHAGAAQGRKAGHDVVINGAHAQGRQGDRNLLGIATLNAA